MTPTPENADRSTGYAHAFTAYVPWGFLPLFLKLPAQIDPVEVVAHRVIWPIPVEGVRRDALLHESDFQRVSG